jgi:hypothetical protein
MNTKIEEILLQSGWFVNRKIDTGKIIYTWKHNNYQFTSQNIAFIENFGLLIIYANNHRIEVNPLKVYCSNDTLNQYIDYFKTPLIPIGSILYENTFLLLDSHNKIYGVFGEFVCFYGNNIFEFIKNVLNNTILWDEIDL